MSGTSRTHVERRRVVHKSTGGTLHSIPEPVDPVGNAPYLTFNTVARVEGGLDIARALTTNTLAVFGTVRQADSERGGDEAQVKARASSQKRARLDLATETHPAGCGGHRLRTA